MAKNPEEHATQAATVEESTAPGQDSARKGKGKMKSKRTKGKSAKSKTGAENPQSPQNAINIGKGKKPDDGTPNKAQLDKENFIASKVGVSLLFLFNFTDIKYPRSMKSVKRQGHRLCGTPKVTLHVHTLTIHVSGNRKIFGVEEIIAGFVQDAKLHVVSIMSLP